jgi:hypothetical protein
MLLGQPRRVSHGGRLFDTLRAPQITRQSAPNEFDFPCRSRTRGAASFITTQHPLQVDPCCE